MADFRKMDPGDPAHVAEWADGFEEQYGIQRAIDVAARRASRRREGNKAPFFAAVAAELIRRAYGDKAPFFTAITAIILKREAEQ